MSVSYQSKHSPSLTLKSTAISDHRSSRRSRSPIKPTDQALFSLFSLSPADVLSLFLLQITLPHPQINSDQAADHRSSLTDQAAVSNHGFVEEKIDAAEPLPPPKQKHRESDSPLPSANNDEEPVACLHDVSYPEGYVPPPPPSSSASAPAKEFPFTLDSFQSESINCLENGESVMVALVDMDLCRWWLSVMLLLWLLVAVVVVVVPLLLVLLLLMMGRINILFYCVVNIILMYRIEE
nr:uncharacterized protein LOC112028550 [Quercus suber]